MLGIIMAFLPFARRQTGAAPGALFVAVLALLMAFGPMSIDMYLPALPRLAAEFGTDQAGVEVTLSAFFVAFGIGQLVWGPLGDRYGRRGPAAAGILLFAAASAGCALADGVAQMAGWRALQAIGACAAPVLARAMVRDMYGRDHAARVLSGMMLIMGAAPLLAPSIGGQVLAHLGWRAIFGVQALFGAVALAGLLAGPETLPPERRASLRWRDMAVSYGTLLGNRRFVGYALCGGFFSAALFTYLAATPFVYIGHFGVAPERYGLLFGLNVLGMIAVNLVNSRLVLRFGSDRLLRLGSWMFAGFALTVAVVGSVEAGGLPGLVAAIFLFMSMAGLMGANSMAGALAAWPHMAGAASALAGGLQFCLGAAAGVAVGWLADGSPAPMSLIIGGFGLASLAANRLLIGRA